MREAQFSTVCPVCKAFMRKKNRRTYECDCGNRLYVSVEDTIDIATGEWVFLEYHSDIEAPADFYPKSNETHPGTCSGCSSCKRYPDCRKYCTELE